MSRRRRIVFGCIGLTAAAAIVAGVIMTRQSSRHSASVREVVFDQNTPLPVLAQALERSDEQAFTVLSQRVLTVRVDQKPKALSEDDAAAWINVVSSLRSSFPRLSALNRGTAVAITGQILDKFAIEPAPARFSAVLPPSHDVFSAALADSAMNVRVAALGEVSRFWVYSPGRSMLGSEEQALADWKESLVAPVVRCLADPQPVMRVAAVGCLAALPIDSEAEPAAAYIADPDVDVRRQVIVSFARRRGLLSDEMLLRRLADNDPRVQTMAEEALRVRGLDKEQIGLGALVMHPRSELRESVIPMLAGRTDIDPVVWLVRLSQDREESVRLKAAEALGQYTAPEARKRLAEMAARDPSLKVKKLAVKLMVPGEETASLPPLPGSPSLTPKAN